MPTGYGAEELNLMEDVDTLQDTIRLMGRLFLCMLARLEREGLLSKNSEVLNLGLIMALFIAMPMMMPAALQLPTDNEPLGPEKDNKKWCPGKFWHHIYAYARKYDIKLEGPRFFDKILAICRANVDLPEPTSNLEHADPFGYYAELAMYKARRGGMNACLSKRAEKGTEVIGGDYLDVTTWSSAERARYSRTGRDPMLALGDGVKNGRVLEKSQGHRSAGAGLRVYTV
ncbi:hypothetical protein QBC34DRAFT_386261 [Podospora aff. communis PSN243]|uniref:Uncharacterized protein n=1 Tax=Podospora aff. communis PSN243 TaxID=3040156 RepID=A0AAV9G4P6_9PEZI|nr:hypothetical protein QBC34DRAFT_386261 [Podospora aff. communis PSN243]